MKLKMMSNIREWSRPTLLVVNASLILFFLSACKATAPMPTVSKVDLNRFMGRWYVIAHIPTSIEKDAYNAVESYRLSEDGSVATTFRFNQGAADGPLKEYHPTGFVRDDTSNAVWGMQFIWPFKAEYLIIYLDDDYSQTVIGRSKRDYLWIMARQPSIPEADYRRIIEFVADRGYDVDQIRKVPQTG